jgi:ATP-dependent protease ClpP protease subunit
MFHGVGFDVTSPTRFEEKVLRERIQGIEASQTGMASLIAERTELGLDAVRAMFLEAVTLDAEKAKAKGIVDTIKGVDIPNGASIAQLVFQR